jgi:predicted nucleic acid-binding protein
VIVLDTNVLSALMRDRPDAAVLAWMDRLPAESLWTTSITLYELHYGVALLTAGRRRKSLEDRLRRMIDEDLENRVLDFDVAAALEAAELAAERQRAGRPVDIRDTQIAGIVRARRGAVATRNVRHFQDAGIDVVDPWYTDA